MIKDKCREGKRERGRVEIIQGRFCNEKWQCESYNKPRSPLMPQFSRKADGDDEDDDGSLSLVGL